MVTSVHRGPVGTHGRGVLFTRNSERQMKLGTGNRAVLSMGALSDEPGGGDPFLRTLKFM